MIFHLEIQVYVNQYGNLCDRDSFYSNVYTSYETAYKKGIQELNRRVIKLKEENTDYDDETVDTFIKEMICYKFLIHELIILEEQEKQQQINKMFELSFKTKVEISKETNLYELCRSHSSSINYEFDYLGNLIDRTEWPIGNRRMPSDYDEDAGVRFAVGDVVRADNSYGKEYCIVTRVPGRLRDAKNVFNWENIYALDFVIIQEGKILRTYDTFYEHQIEKVEDETIYRQVKKLISEAEYKSDILCGISISDTVDKVTEYMNHLDAKVVEEEAAEGYLVEERGYRNYSFEYDGKTMICSVNFQGGVVAGIACYEKE